MTKWKRPGNGDSEIAAPADDPGASTAVIAEAGSTEDILKDDEPFDTAERDEVVRRRERARPSNVIVLLGAILVLVIAQAVLSWLSFDVSRQLRDQSAIANGLQRCLIQAQLNENTSTDPSGAAYKAAVQSCLSR
jgi:hypothetical protein